MAPGKRTSRPCEKPQGEEQGVHASCIAVRLVLQRIALLTAPSSPGPAGESNRVNVPFRIRDSKGDHMSKLPIAGILVLMLLIVSGYVASEPSEMADEALADSAVPSLDPHVNYYQQYMLALKIVRPAL
jgi:hypothetical protein